MTFQSEIFLKQCVSLSVSNAGRRLLEVEGQILNIACPFNQERNRIARLDARQTGAQIREGINKITIDRVDHIA